MTTLRVLQVEDSPIESELSLRVLRSAGYTVDHTRVEDADAMASALRSAPPDIILADFSMPRFDGFAALSLARALAPHVPFIFVSGTIGEERAVTALTNGATDYVLKGNLRRLPAAVRRALDEAASRRARLRAETMLTKLIHGGPDAVLVATPEGVITLANTRADALFGAERGTLEGCLIATLMPERESLAARAAADEALRAPGSSFTRETLILRLDGRELDVEVSVAAFETDEDLWIAVTVRDISARKAQAALLAHIARLHAALSAVNEAVARATGRTAVLVEVARITVETAGLDGAWIGTVDAERGTLTGVAHAGDPAVEAAAQAVADEAARWFSIEVSASGSFRAPTGRTDPFVGGDGAVAAHGFAGCFAVPVRVDGRNVGVIVFFRRSPAGFEEPETTLLAQVGADVSFGLERFHKDEQIAYLARFDTTTGLPNRTRFLERLDALLARDGAPEVAVAVVDVERFRHVCESFGRAGGDLVLAEIAARLRRLVVDVDLLARVGPDRFAVAFESDRRGAEAYVRGVLSACFREPFLVGGEAVSLAGIVGYAVAPDDGAAAEILVRNTEAALKAAKATRTSCRRYDAAMNANVAQKLSIETRLRRAIDADQFVLHYQPKIELATGAIVGAEALIRWMDPEGGIVPPAVFIPVLEDTGLIQVVGRWVVTEAVRRAAEWRARFRVAPRIAVNVSELQIRRDDFVLEMRRALGDADDPGIDIEITESLFMQDLKGNIRKIEAVREMGPRVAIDDFGTGYSSLSYVALLPVDTLKIDRSFVTDMATTANAMAIASTMISLGHALGFSVVAEGVETEQQAHLLRLLRCDQVQGYYFSRPLPQDGFEALLAAHEATPRSTRRKLTAALARPTT